MIDPFEGSRKTLKFFANDLLTYSTKRLYYEHSTDRVLVASYLNDQRDDIRTVEEINTSKTQGASPPCRPSQDRGVPRPKGLQRSYLCLPMYKVYAPRPFDDPLMSKGYLDRGSTAGVQDSAVFLEPNKWMFTSGCYERLAQTVDTLG